MKYVIWFTKEKVDMKHTKGGNKMSENFKSGVAGNSVNESVKELADLLKKVNANSEGVELPGMESNAESIEENSKFKVASTNLPAKPTLWTKIKNVLFYEIKVELTPYQQKVEREINEFLHQPITWKSLKEAALSEVPITFRGKRIF